MSVLILACVSFAMNTFALSKNATRENEEDANYDQIAKANRDSVRLRKTNGKCKWTSPFLFKPALRRPKERVVHRRHCHLKGCGMCGRSLCEVKCSGDTLKFTECGHIFCGKCSNESAWQKCITCSHRLKRHGALQLYNLYL